MYFLSEERAIECICNLATIPQDRATGKDSVANFIQHRVRAAAVDVFTVPGPM